MVNVLNLINFYPCIKVIRVKATAAVFTIKTSQKKISQPRKRLILRILGQFKRVISANTVVKVCKAGQQR